MTSLVPESRGRGSPVPGDGSYLVLAVAPRGEVAVNPSHFLSFHSPICELGGRVAGCFLSLPWCCGVQNSSRPGGVKAGA